VVGIDTSSGMLNRAAEIARSYPEGRGVGFVRAAVHFLPFRKSLFNIVLCLGATLPLLGFSDIKLSLGDFSRVLVQAGSFIGHTRDFDRVRQQWKKNSSSRFLPIRTRGSIYSYGQDL